MHDTLQRWAGQHALLMSLGIGGVLLEKSTLLLAAMAAGSFLGLLIRCRGRYTENGRFGLANALTLSRVIGAVGLLLAADAGPWWLAGGIALLAVAGLAGWAYRDGRPPSTFGQRFDQESDALLLLAASLLLFVGGRLGGWILLAGALPYFFVLLRRMTRRPLVLAASGGFSRAAGVMATLGFTVCLLPVTPAQVVSWLAAGLSVLLAGTFLYSAVLLDRSHRR